MGFSFISVIPLFLSDWVFILSGSCWIIEQPVTHEAGAATAARGLAVALAAPARGAFGNRRAPTKAQAEFAARVGIRLFS
jgi:hypothetical protein